MWLVRNGIPPPVPTRISMKNRLLRLSAPVLPESMSDILFIKTSSLGDVIHHMPAVSDARRHLPQARIGWVVEEAFAPLVRLHRAVDSVIPVASRRWRASPLSPSTWREIAAFQRAMRDAAA